MISGRQGRTGILMATACGGLFAYGILTAFLGATIPELRARIGFPMEANGWLFSVFYFPQIPAVCAAGVLIDRLGKKLLLTGGCLLAGLSVVGIAYAPSYRLLALLLFFLGLAGSFISISANKLVADIYPRASSSAFNLGHTFFGLGAVSVPALMAIRAGPFGLRGVLWIVGAFVVLVGAIGLLQPFPSPHITEDVQWRLFDLAKFGLPLLLLAGIAFLTTALLASLAAWIRPFLEQCCRASARQSSLLLSFFWGFICLGRFAASHLVKKVHGMEVLFWACLGLLGGLVMLALALGLRSAALAIFVCGLCYAPIFPTTVGVTHSLFPKFFGTALGIIMASNLCGGLVLPALVGCVAGAGSLRAGIWVLVGSAGLLALAQILFMRTARRMAE